MGRGSWAALGLLIALAASGDVANGGFESGGFDGWQADDNWVVIDHTAGYYAGWADRWWAWSGGRGEPAMGNLTSRPFVLDRDGVRLLISGWTSSFGTGRPRRWNYVTLNLADGTEIDRVWAPDTTNFVPVWLDGSKHRGATVFVRAVDDADQPTFSMLCIDDVRTADLPPDLAAPLPEPPAYDARRHLRLADERIVVDVDRRSGSIVRVRDAAGGLELVREARLAGSWRTSLVLPGREPWETIEANWLFGRDQTLTGYRYEGSRLTLHWAGPLRNYLGEAYDLSATMTIALRDGGAWFGLRFDNRTPFAVGETYFPVLGGLRGFGARLGAARTTELIRPVPLQDGAPSVASASVFRVFANQSPFGDQGPEQFWAVPAAQPAPWLGFLAPRLGRGVLVAAREATSRPLFARLELVPSSSGTVRDDGNWPRAAELQGLPCGVELTFVDCAVGSPGASYEPAPVVVRWLDGPSDALPAAFDALPAWPDPAFDGQAATAAPLPELEPARLAEPRRPPRRGRR